MIKFKIVGKVDLSTGIIYDAKGDIVPKKPTPKCTGLDEERLARRRAWLAGEFSYLP